SKDRPFLILGHCRAATLGEVSDNNAHPFDMGNIIGAHNGTVHSIRGKSATGTDSEALFKILSEEGLQETVNAAKHGAYALTWIDTNKHTLNIIRNSQRPLYTMLARGVLYWASEFYMLRLVGHRDNINTVPEMLEVDTHLEIDLHNPL